MSNGENILISLESRHAENILSGIKRVELRRRPMHVECGTTVWIYVKVPVGSLVGCATVKNVVRSSPGALWRRFGAISGLSRDEFFEYFEGAEEGVALMLENAEKLNAGLSLRELREVESGFQPPQFFVRLDSGHPILNAVAEIQLADCA